MGKLHGMKLEFLAVYTAWTGALKAVYSCCPAHEQSAMELALHMTSDSTEAVLAYHFKIITEEQCCAVFKSYIDEMKKHIKSLKKTIDEQLRKSSVPAATQRQARA